MAIHGDLLLEAWMDPGNPGNPGKTKPNPNVNMFLKLKFNIIFDTWFTLAEKIINRGINDRNGTGFEEGLYATKVTCSVVIIIHSLLSLNEVIPKLSRER